MKKLIALLLKFSLSKKELFEQYEYNKYLEMIWFGEQEKIRARKVMWAKLAIKYYVSCLVWDGVGCCEVYIYIYINSRRGEWGVDKHIYIFYCLI